MTELQQVHDDLMSAIEGVIECSFVNRSTNDNWTMSETMIFATFHRAYEQYRNTPIMPMVD